MKRVMLLVVVAVSTLTQAQEIKFVDLSAAPQRIELRYPHTNPSGGGVGGVGVGDSAPDRKDPHWLGVALDHVAPTDITLEPFEAEFRVINTGFAPIEIPVSPDLSDLQPPEASEPFTYFSLSLVIYFDGTGEKQALGIGWVDMYGSAKHEGTMLTLEPGQWVRVKSKVKLHTWPSEPVPARLTARFWFRKNLFTTQGGDKRFLQITNLYPNPTQFVSIPVRFSPTRSGRPPLPQTH